MVHACCLMEDFNLMPLGGLTKVGEMGMSLSGGQKSRLSLARALYRQDSNIVLIDSSLSSLDAQVTRQVMERAIKGGLTAEKLVMIVTNDLDLASEMDHVLYVSEGTVK